jgi:hypothetical protein
VALAPVLNDACAHHFTIAHITTHITPRITLMRPSFTIAHITAHITPRITLLRPSFTIAHITTHLTPHITLLRPSFTIAHITTHVTPHITLARRSVVLVPPTQGAEYPPEIASLLMPPALVAELDAKAKRWSNFKMSILSWFSNKMRIKLIHEQELRAAVSTRVLHKYCP